MNFEKFKSLPEFLCANDLVNLGLYPTKKALYFSRLRGNTPNFVKIGKRILYPKTFVMKFLENRMQTVNFFNEAEDIKIAQKTGRV